MSRMPADATTTDNAPPPPEKLTLLQMTFARYPDATWRIQRILDCVGRPVWRLRTAAVMRSSKAWLRFCLWFRQRYADASLVVRLRQRFQAYAEAAAKPGLLRSVILKIGGDLLQPKLPLFVVDTHVVIVPPYGAQHAYRIGAVQNNVYHGKPPQEDIDTLSKAKDQPPLGGVMYRALRNSDGSVSVRFDEPVSDGMRAEIQRYAERHFADQDKAEAKADAKDKADRAALAAKAARREGYHRETGASARRLRQSKKHKGQQDNA